MGKPKSKSGEGTTMAGVASWAGIIIALLSTLQMVWKEKPWFVEAFWPTPIPAATAPARAPASAPVVHYEVQPRDANGVVIRPPVYVSLPPPAPVPLPPPAAGEPDDDGFTEGPVVMSASPVNAEPPSFPWGLVTLGVGVVMILVARLYIWRKRALAALVAHAQQATTVVVPKL